MSVYTKKLVLIESDTGLGFVIPLKTEKPQEIFSYLLEFSSYTKWSLREGTSIDLTEIELEDCCFLRAGKVDVLRSDEDSQLLGIRYTTEIDKDDELEQYKILNVSRERCISSVNVKEEEEE